MNCDPIWGRITKFGGRRGFSKTKNFWTLNDQKLIKNQFDSTTRIVRYVCECMIVKERVKGNIGFVSKVTGDGNDHINFTHRDPLLTKKISPDLNVMLCYAIKMINFMKT